jgi:hypothetical protein
MRGKCFGTMRMFVLLSVLSILSVSAEAATRRAPVTGGFTVSWTNSTNNLDCYDTARCKPINAANCTAAIDSAWNVQLSIANSVSIPVGSTLFMWPIATGSDCVWPSTTAPENTKSTQTATAITNFVFPDAFPDLTYTTKDLLTAVQGTANFCTEPVDLKNFEICFAVDSNGDKNISSNDLRGSIVIPVDTKPPPQPDEPTLTAADGQITVKTKLKGSTDADKFEIRYRELAEDATSTDCAGWDNTYKNQSATATTVTTNEVGESTLDYTLSDLVNSQTYEVCVVAKDLLGNVSPASATLSATPIDECDFAQCYPAKLQTGYCGATSMPYWGAVLALLLLRRKKKLPAAVPAVILVSVALLSAQAQARKQDDIPNWGIELRLGPYSPAISNDPAAKSYYHDMFKAHDKSLFKGQPLMKAIEGDYYFWRDYGLLGALFRVGQWQASGTTFKCSSSVCSAATNTGIPGTGTNQLLAIPLNVGLVYRMDLMKRYWNIPLVIYGKATIDYYFWWARTQGKIAKTEDGKSAKGGSWGYSYGGGLSFNLDFLDPRSSIHGRATSNIADSYLFMEVQQSKADNFGNKHHLDFSGTLYLAGISVDIM